MNYEELKKLRDPKNTLILPNNQTMPNDKEKFGALAGKVLTVYHDGAAYAQRSDGALVRVGHQKMGKSEKKRFLAWRRAQKLKVTAAGLSSPLDLPVGA